MAGFQAPGFQVPGFQSSVAVAVVVKHADIPCGRRDERAQRRVDLMHRRTNTPSARRRN